MTIDTGVELRGVKGGQRQRRSQRQHQRQRRGGQWQRRWQAARARCAWVVALWLIGAGCTTGVLHGLDEPTANEALAALERAGIAADKAAEDGTATPAAAGGPSVAFALRVSRGDASRALDVLRILGLPRERHHGFAEVYGRPSFIPSASEERARYIQATAGEIERTLETAEGITNARVHLVLEESDPLSLEAKPRSGARAAVLIKVARGRTPLAESDVQKLVAGSVPGLDARAVTVIMTPAPAPMDRNPATLAAVGPWRVTPASRVPLLMAFAVGLAIIAALATLLLVTLRRRLRSDS